MTPEGKVKALIKRLISETFRGGAYRFMPVQNGMGAPALDFYYCILGQFVAIEAKAPGKKPTLRQRETMAQIQEAGGLAFVVDSQESLESAIAVIQL